MTAEKLQIEDARPAEMKIGAIVPMADWRGCYEGNWNGLITPDSFRHPAKFARGLIERIYEHGLQKGYWAKGDLIGDPFAGIACGGIVAAYKGLRWVGVELEAHFVALAYENFYLHVDKWLALGDPLPVILQGDSRRFAQILRCPAAGVVTSPPYVSGGHHADQTGAWGGRLNDHEHRGLGSKEAAGYGKAPGQIGQLPPGELGGVITSPPYAESIKGDHREKETADETAAKRKTEGGSLGQSQRHGGYGSADGNIGNLPEGQVKGIVTSPPYAESETASACKAQNPAGRQQTYKRAMGCNNYGSTPANIGNLREGQLDGAVTSPPYAELGKGGPDHRPDRVEGTAAPKLERDSYGQAPGQIGRESGETYWRAVWKVYRQCLEALKPGGVMAVVVKDYVKDRKRIPLCEQTLSLLAAIGFEPLERIRAHLVSETKTRGLFGTTTKRTERKSFFRRLAEKKGSPRIDWEEVLFVRKTTQPQGRLFEEQK